MKNLKKKIISGTMLVTLLTYTMPILAFTNEETVYSKLDSNGEKYKSIVSTFSEEDEIVQSETEKELPVDCKVKYELNEKEITPEELAGKSGKVKITLEYTNKLENVVDINGNTETIYTPFLVVSGTIIDNENNKNIEISNGKVINDGSKTIVMGIAMPGMQESLKVSEEDDFEIPSKIEITMDSENFELGNIMSFCTPQILEDGDLDNILDKTDELFDQVNSLQDATNQIEEGAIKLNDGVVVLNDGAQRLNSGATELESGIGTLKSGTSKITSGANSLKSGTKEYTDKSREFNNAMKQVTAGASTLNSSYDALNNGLAQLNVKAPELAIGAEQVSAGIEKLYGALADLNGKLGGNISNSSNQTKTVSISPNNEDKISRIQSITASNENLINSLKANNDTLHSIIASTDDEGVKSSIEAQISANDSIIASLRANDSEINGISTTLNEPITYTENATVTDSNTNMEIIKQTVAKLTSSAGELSVGAGEVSKGAKDAQDAIAVLSSGSASVKSGLANLAGSSNGLLDANNKLSEAANTIANGAQELANGTVSLEQGVNRLADGTTSLKNGTMDLSNGTNELLNGSDELVDGIKEFNTDGIKKIYNSVNGDLKNTVARIEKLEELSNNYNRFASEDERDAIKFINILDSIKTSVREEDKEDIVISRDNDEKEE